MDLVETRELAYFVAVAEELHFGRAARRLGITQPPLSRAIGRLERRLGVPLLMRTSRHVQLTPAGEALLRDGRGVLGAVAAAVRRARRAGHPERRLVLVMKAGADGGVLARLLEAYRREPEALPVEVLHSVDERGAMVRDGRADVALLHRPNNDLEGLDTEDVLVERGQVVVLSPAHRFAGRRDVTLADLRTQTFLRWPEAAADQLGPGDVVVGDLGQLMHLVATGEGIAVIPESAVGLVPRGLSCVPVRDAPPVVLVLAWPEDSQSRPLAALVRTAARLSGQH
ncbi:MAG: LysR family transcriptional regulator [Kutzneria sp.]|nr:LysR family transcriptional regulator [Kutzneria sp.]MBV9846095.1 LysR family transcriptional regulator [Kutzneria sp.]